MQYICLVYHDESGLDRIDDADLVDEGSACISYIGELEKSGHHVYSSGLQTSRNTTTLRLRDGKVSVTDGPFSETKEVLGGFTIIEARDLNEALQLASKFPALHHGIVEVRPLMDLRSDPTDPADRRVANCLREAMRRQQEPAAI